MTIIKAFTEHIHEHPDRLKMTIAALMTALGNVNLAKILNIINTDNIQDVLNIVLLLIGIIYGFLGVLERIDKRRKNKNIKLK